MRGKRDTMEMFLPSQHRKELKNSLCLNNFVSFEIDLIFELSSIIQFLSRWKYLYLDKKL